MPALDVDRPAPPVTDDAAYRRYRSLAWRERWRMGWRARWSDVPGRPDEVAMRLWVVRRDLALHPWLAVFLLLFAGVGVAILYHRGARPPMGGGLLGGPLGALIGQALVRRRLRRNERDLVDALSRSTGASGDGLTGWPLMSGRQALVTLLAVALLLVGFDRFVAVTSSRYVDLDEVFGALQRLDAVPAEAPAMLHDGRPPEPVSPEVAAAWPGRDVVLGRTAQVDLDEQECTGRLRGAAFGPALVLPAAYQMAGLRESGASIQYVVCLWDERGRLWALEPRPALSDGPVLGSGTGWSSAVEGITTERVVRVPAGAVWVTHDVGGWVLGLPVEGVPLVQLRLVTRGEEPTPTVGVIRFLDAEGAVVLALPGLLGTTE